MTIFKNTVLAILILLSATCAHAIHSGECVRGTIHHNKLYALIEACKCNFIDVVEELIDGGVELDADDSQGWTPLMTALGNSNYEITDLLIKRGANINFKAENGETTMFMAVRSGSIRRVKYLISKGANVNEKNNDGMTPIFFLKYIDSAIIADLLIEAGADVNVRGTDGKSLLFYYKERTSDERIINLLIANGAKE